MRRTFDEMGVAQPEGIRLTCVNRIPHARGLGSSSAAIVAGILAARALSGASFDDDKALALATAIEGHPDNVAPCLRGGLTISWDSGVRKLLPHPRHPAGGPDPAVPVVDGRGTRAPAG